MKELLETKEQAFQNFLKSSHCFYKESFLHLPRWQSRGTVEASSISLSLSFFNYKIETENNRI